MAARSTYERGLTLVELLVGLALAALLLMPLAVLFQTAAQSAQAGGDQLEQAAQARFAARRIATTMRAQAAVTLPATPDDTGTAIPGLRYWVRRTGALPEVMETRPGAPGTTTPDRVLAVPATLAVTAPVASDGGQLISIVVSMTGGGSASETVRLGSAP